MSKNISRRLARRDFLRYALAGGVGTGLLGVLAACQQPAAAPTTAPKATEAPKPAATTAPAPAATTAPAPAAAAAATKAPAKFSGVTLNLWQHWSGNLEKVLRDMVTEFNNSGRGITMNVTTVPLSDMWTKVLAAVAAGAPPDSYTSAAMVRPELAKDKAIEDLNKYGKRPDLLKAFDSPTVFMGGWYGVPNNGGLWTMCYNKELYTKAGLDANKGPQTWNDLVEHGKKLTDPASNQFGIVLPNKPVSWTTEVWYGFLLEAGGDFLTPDNSAAAFNSDAGVKALQFWVDLAYTHKVSSLSSMDNNGVQAAYSTGKVGMWTMYPVISGSIGALNFKSGNNPAPKGDKQGTHFAGTYMPMMSGGKNKEALWEFFSWWMQPETNGKWCALTGGLPITQAVTQTQVYKDYLKSQPLAQAYVDSFDIAKPLPLVIGISEMEQVVAEAIEAAVIGKQPVKATLDAAAQKVNDIIKKYKS